MQDLPNIEELLQLLEQQNQTIQEQTQKIAELETKLAEAYRKIETLSNSDKELQAARRHEANAMQTEQDARNKLDSANLKLSEAQQQENANKQKEKQLQKQAEKLTEREKQLKKSIIAAKEQAAKDARAELEEEREQLLKEQKALEAAKKDADKQTEEAKQKAYDDAINNNEWLIRALRKFCFVVGIAEVIKHITVITAYKGWYIWLAAKTGNDIAAAVIMVLAWVVPLLGYLYPSSNTLYIAYRLIAIIGMLMLADFAKPSTAAIIIYVAGWLIAGGRYCIKQLDKPYNL